MKKHKLSTFIAIGLFAISVMLPIFSSISAVAQDSETLTLKEQYKIWRSYRAVVDCFRPDTNGINSVGAGIKESYDSDDDVLDSIFVSDNYVTGFLYNEAVGLDESYYNCHEDDDMNIILSNLGYSNARDFVDAIKASGIAPLTKANLTTWLNNKVRTELNSGVDLFGKPAFRYWYANELFRGDSENYCGEGILRDTAGSGNRDSSISEEDYFYVNSDGGLEPKEYANFNSPKDRTKEGVDEYATRSILSNKPNCTKIAAQLNETNARAYADLVITGVESSAGTVDLSIEGAEEEDSCETKGGDLSWILCPILSGSAWAIRTMDDFIQKTLNVEEKYYNNANLKSAWRNIRNIAYFVIIPAMLIIVISTALGFSFLDAYTVKKAMPRIIIAVMFMALSYEICVFMIETVNIIGKGIGGIIAAPFGGTEELTFDVLFKPDQSDSTVFFGGIIAGGALTAITVGPAVIGLMASYALVAAIAIAIILALLTIRELVIIFLILLAPLAIISWVFPGKDGGWKLWWNTFTKMLLLYPIIMGLLVAGRVFATIIPKGSGIEGAFNVLAKLVVYIAPFFFIPQAFKLAGSAFANIAGVVNNRSKGVFDRQRKYRGEKMGQAKEGRKSGNLYKGKNALTNRLNTAAAVGSNLGKAGLDPRHMRSRMRTALNTNSEAQIDEFSKNPDFQQMNGDDAKLWAARHENADDIANELAARDAGRFAGPGNARAREDAVQQIMRAQKATNRDTFQRARIRSQATTGTGYQNAQGEFDASLMLDDINQTYGNDRNGAAGAIAGMRNPLTQAGQVAGQAGFATWAGQAEEMYRAQNSNITQQQRLQVAQNAHEAIMDNAIDSASPQYALHGKPSSARAMGAAHARRIQEYADSINSGTQVINTGQTDAQGNAIMRAASQEDLDAALAGSAGIYDAMSSSTPQNASAFANELMGVRINGSRTMQTNTHSQSTSDLTVRELIQDRDSSGPQEYIDRRRNTYQSYSQQAQQQNLLNQQQNPPQVNGPGNTPPNQPGGPGP